MATVCRFHRSFLSNLPLRQLKKSSYVPFQPQRLSCNILNYSRWSEYQVSHVVRSFADSVKSRASSGKKAANGIKKNSLDIKKPVAEVKKSEVKRPEVKKPEVKKPEVNLTLDEELAKLSLYERYKKLALEYWYVLVPVHGGLSVAWLGSCYLFARSGVEIDLVGIMEYLHFPEVVVKPLRSPSVGYFAVALALYKIISPLRYLSTVTLTIPVIRLLVRMGKIKPVPSREKIKRMVTSRIRRKRGEKQ